MFRTRLELLSSRAVIFPPNLVNRSQKERFNSHFSTLLAGGSHMRLLFSAPQKPQA
jgi:hypothetical protein